MGAEVIIMINKIKELIPSENYELIQQLDMVKREQIYLNNENIKEC